jgi:hypothetical protein
MALDDDDYAVLKAMNERLWESGEALRRIADVVEQQQGDEEDE